MPNTALSQDTRHTFSTAELASADLSNIREKLDAFLNEIRPDLQGALGAASLRPNVEAELSYLRETIVEHLRTQLPDAFEAVEEWGFQDPLADRAVAS